MPDSHRPTPEQLEAAATERLNEELGPMWLMPEGHRPVPPGPNPIDENDERLATGQ
jgi:hypothetical protein